MGVLSCSVTSVLEKSVTLATQVVALNDKDGMWVIK